MSPVIPEAGGLVVISEVGPENDERRGPAGQSSNTAGSMPKPVVTFYRGEPEVLGTTQIFSGILLLSIGIVLIIVKSKDEYQTELVNFCGIPIWSGILFIISGSLSVAASVKPTARKVTASLVMNIISSVAAGCGIILVVLDIGLGESYHIGFKMWTFCAHYNNDLQCLGAFTPLPIHRTILSYMLLVFLLIFCISISTSVFACRTVCRGSFQEMTVVIYQTTSVIASDTSRGAPPPDYTAAATSDLKSQT